VDTKALIWLTECPAVFVPIGNNPPFVNIVIKRVHAARIYTISRYNLCHTFIVHLLMYFFVAAEVWNECGDPENPGL